MPPPPPPFPWLRLWINLLRVYNVSVANLLFYKIACCWLYNTGNGTYLSFVKKKLARIGLVDQGRHDRTCERARKGHSRSLKSANKQKIFVDKLSFLSHLAQHTLKLLARISLRDVRSLC